MSPTSFFAAFENKKRCF
ncbi:MAG: hypothetical protein ACLS48_02900 [[Eubacterium] siraeum]